MKYTRKYEVIILHNESQMTQYMINMGFLSNSAAYKNVIYKIFQYCAFFTILNDRLVLRIQRTAGRTDA